MSLPLAIALYFVVWWTILFAILPFGIRKRAGGEHAPGTEPAAPAEPRLLVKALWTSLVALVIVAALDAVLEWRLVTLDGLPWGPTFH